VGSSSRLLGWCLAVGRMANTDDQLVDRRLADRHIRSYGAPTYQAVRRTTSEVVHRHLPAWGDVFGDAVVASAILDRLMHRAVVFNIKGPSWRMREHQALAEAVTQ